jgi:putative hydrolase of the HAD superfamily
LNRETPIKALIFDLDNCLSPADAMGADFYRPAFEAIRAANEGSLSDAVLDQAFADMWRHPYDAVCALHGFNETMAAAGWAVFTRLEVCGPMPGYPDLALLDAMPRPLFLVTSGFARLQASKIRSLGLGPKFDAVFIDAIDAPERRGKGGIFAAIAAEHGFHHGEVCVIGDSPLSEIEAGKRLGMQTVQILRPGVAKGDNACHYVRDLQELRQLLAPRVRLR